MIEKAYYKCASCNATAEITDNLLRNGNAKHTEFQDKIVCGWRGCTDYRVRVHNG